MLIKSPDYDPYIFKSISLTVFLTSSPISNIFLPEVFIKNDVIILPPLTSIFSLILSMVFLPPDPPNVANNITSLPLKSH